MIQGVLNPGELNHMNRNKTVAVRLDPTEFRSLERVSNNIDKSLSSTSRLAIGYAIELVAKDPYTLLDYAKKNKQQAEG